MSQNYNILSNYPKVFMLFCNYITIICKNKHEKFASYDYYYYFCKMNHKVMVFCLCGIVLFLTLSVYLRAPLVVGSLTKQTMYLWFLDCWYGQSRHSKARVMLVDDDSEEGIFKIKKICDEAGVKAAFAVIPSRIGNVLGDSLRMWQKEGFGICLHGYNHDHWKDWSYDAVTEDIDKSNKTLAKMGFHTEKIKYIVPPHSSNTVNIRKAIEDKKYQMICGANIVNPDTNLFQLGRLFISKATDLNKIKIILEKAKNKKMFVILGTHSSDPEEFSEEKTKAVLHLAKEMKYEFYY